MTDHGELESTAIPRPDIDVLEAWIRRVVGEVLDHEKMDILTKSQREAMLLIGPCMQVMRYANAFLLLRESGFERESTLMARAALEHAVIVQWSYLTENGISRFHVWALANEKNHWEKVGKWSKNQEIIAEAESMPTLHGKAMKSMANYGGILDLMDDGEFFQLAQTVLSQTLHISPTTVRAFVNPLAHNEVVRDPTLLFPFENVFTMASSVSLVAWVLADLRHDYHVLDAMVEDGSKIGVPATILPHIKPSQRRGFLPRYNSAFRGERWQQAAANRLTAPFSHHAGVFYWPPAHWPSHYC